MNLAEYIAQMESDLQKTSDKQFQNALKICISVMRLLKPFEGLSPTVNEPFNTSPPEKEFMWDKELLVVPSGRDIEAVHKLGFPNIKGMIKYSGKKMVYFTDSDESIAFSKSKYNADYANEGPMVGKDNEIELFNKIDWWVVCRYSADSTDYVDMAVFDCRNLMVGNLNGDVNFSSPHPDGSHIDNKETWFKVLGLQKREG